MKEFDDYASLELTIALRECGLKGCSEVALRPTYSAVMRWLRSKNIHIEVSLSDYDDDEAPKWNAVAFYIRPERTEFLHSDDDSCNSYEETFENICLKVLSRMQITKL